MIGKGSLVQCIHVGTCQIISKKPVFDGLYTMRNLRLGATYKVYETTELEDGTYLQLQRDGTYYHPARFQLLDDIISPL